MQGGDPTCVNAKYYMELQNFGFEKNIQKYYRDKNSVCA